MQLFKLEQEIKILAQFDGELHEFVTKIRSVHEDEITVYGTYKGRSTPFKQGTDVEILFTQPDAFYSLQSTIISETTFPDHLLVFKGMREKINRLQRRRFFRVATRLRIAFAFLGIEEGKRQKIIHSTFTKNISGGGLYFYFENPLQVGEILPLEVFLPDEEKPIEAKGRIVRRDTIKKPDIMLNAYGINFEKIQESDRTTLITFLNRIQGRVKQI
ncbi:MAG: PilZ domain-containing protein [Deferribacteres bacterium]|nr:PilZ domain-containing protein [candidate division KSB1 bacterium]MCB9500572.1 PilZ domain-containing protein [Deferribacteres bacterium]